LLNKDQIDSQLQRKLATNADIVERIKPIESEEKTEIKSDINVQIAKKFSHEVVSKRSFIEGLPPADNKEFFKSSFNIEINQMNYRDNNSISNIDSSLLDKIKSTPVEESKDKVCKLLHSNIPIPSSDLPLNK